MKIVRKELLTKLEACAPGISKTQDTEQGACFALTPGQIATFNEEIACIAQSPLNVTCAVPARPLLDTLRKLTEDELDITLGEGRLLIKCPGMRRIGVTIHQDVVDYISRIDRATSWVDVQPAFADGLAMVAECAAKESEQFAWTCIEISPKGLQATDGFQALRYKVECPVDASFLIRRESCTAVAGQGVAAINVGTDWLGFKTYSGLEVYVRRYTEDFPDLSQAFDAEVVSSLRLPPSVIDSCQKALPFLAETSTGKQVVLRLKPGKMLIHAQNVNGFFEEIKDVPYEGPARSFALNPKYIEALMKHDHPLHLGQHTAKIRGEGYSLVCSLESAVA